MPAEKDVTSARTVASEITVAWMSKKLEKMELPPGTKYEDGAAKFGEICAIFYEKVFTKAKQLGP